MTFVGYRFVPNSPKTIFKEVEEHQERLKEVGDWKIFSRNVELIARGHFALDEDSRVHMDGRPVLALAQAFRLKSIDYGFSACRSPMGRPRTHFSRDVPS